MDIFSMMMETYSQQAAIPSCTNLIDEWQWFNRDRCDDNQIGTVKQCFYQLLEFLGE